MVPKLTRHTQQVFVLAKQLADRLHQPYVGTDHLLLALLEFKQSFAVRILRQCGCDVEAVQKTFLSFLFQTSSLWMPTTILSEEGMIFTPRAQKVLQLAFQFARENHCFSIGTEHLLLALLEEKSGLGACLLNFLPFDREQCRKKILCEMHSENNNHENESNEEEDEGMDEGNQGPEEDDTKEEGSIFVRRSKPSISLLKTYGQNLTQKALQNELDPVIGREREIERLIQILCRRTKNNPVLIGEAGVGKTAVVEGLAQRIVQHQVPDMLLNKTIIQLDLALLLSGTKYRGQFEERIKRLLEEAQNRSIILFLDELHTIVGTGSAEGSMDASNILKPALARGQLQCIGATTLNEYRMYIEKDSALNRRFQAILIEQPSPSDTIKILHGLKDRYEAFHQVRYPEAILKQSVQLTQRYINNRCFPDKAIDLLDEAGARTKILRKADAPSTQTIDRSLQSLQTKKRAAIHHLRFEEAARYRDQEQALQRERTQLLEAWKQKTDHQRIPVKESTLQKIVFDWTGVPVEKMGKHELHQYLNLEKTLNRSLIGQEEAVKTIAQALKRSRTDLKDPQRPMGSFLFLGPTGVGKTYVVKLLAEQIFGDRNALIQLDMSEYMEKHTVSRLIGAPPGYIGYENGGQLTERVRRKPYCMILLDEIEKAHPDAIQILLQVLEEGHLTDNLGHCVDFKNTIIVMTSNVGAQELQRNGLGFGIASTNAAFEQMKASMYQSAKEVFRPELLNRISECVVFRPLTHEHMHSIVKLELKIVQNRLKEKAITLQYDQEVIDFLIAKGFDEKMGARPLKRTIERYVENPLADEWLRGKIKTHQKITLQVRPDASSILFHICSSKTQNMSLKTL